MLATEEALKRFRDQVVKNARTNLTKGNKNVTRSLYDSIKGFYKVMPNSISLEFEMLPWGEFQDKGVKGAGGVRKSTSKFNRRNNKGKIWKQKAPNSPFSFKMGDENKPSVKHFVQWSNSKGLNPYAVRDSVYHQGIKPSLFFTKAFEAAYKNLPAELIEAYGLEVEEQFITIIKQP